MLQMGDIVHATAFITGISYGNIRGPRAYKDHAVARHLAMHTIKKVTDNSLPRIGSYFDRDHTTVLYGIRRVERFLTEDPEYWGDLLEKILTESYKRRDMRVKLEWETVNRARLDLNGRPVTIDDRQMAGPV